jgi:hypothetical protein
MDNHKIPENHTLWPFDEVMEHENSPDKSICEKISSDCFTNLLQVSPSGF